jgi:type 2 lantibiotic biosynthesis protein LanM
MWTTFDDARSIRRTTVQGLFEGYGEELTTSGYDSFAEKALKTGLSFFFERFPVALRLSGLVIAQWTGACEEFLTRLHADGERLSQTFCGGRDIGTAADVRAGLAESHDGGRAPMVVEFSSGTRLVYKPKDLRLEVAVAKLIGQANDWGAELDLRSLVVLERHVYGWVEYVEHLACAEVDQIRRYYRRAGMLVALTYALDSTDMHMENLIACGEHPVLIDTELILFADMREGVDGSARSVLETGMVPSPHYERKGLDISALGGIGMASQTASPFDHPNTDRMQPRSSAPLAYERPNVPSLGQDVVEPQEFINEIVDGFTTMYRLFMINRDNIIEWLDRVADANVRFLFRSTGIYAQVIKTAFSRSGLASESAFEDALTRLGDAVPGERWEPLVQEEIASLRYLSIPLFTVAAGGREVASGASSTGLSLPRSPADLGRTRLAALDEADLHRQIELIRACWPSPDHGN